MTLIGFVQLLVLLTPSLIAYGRRHHQRHAILALQISALFFGVILLPYFTAVMGISFFVALIWSLTAVRHLERSDSDPGQS